MARTTRGAGFWHVMVVATLPGERWEIEFMDEDGVEIERFTSDGTITYEIDLDDLAALLD